MKATLIQMDIAWGDPRANREAAGRLMLSAEPSDLYVLPEMWNTGYNVEPEEVAEGEDGETLQWMQRMADELDAAVCGSIAVRSGGQYRNRLYFVTPKDSPIKGKKEGRRGKNLLTPGGGREVAFYDKHHLFSYGREDEHYTPGSERVTVEWRGVRYRLSVCYDLRFPLWLRNRDDYDALICVASWPAVRMHAWRVLLQARAIENQCYVLGVNRVGTDPVCQYCGGTAFVSPYGNMTALPDDAVSTLTQTLDMDRLRSFHDKFPVLKDADAIFPAESFARMLFFS